MSTLIDGRALASDIKHNVREQIVERGVKPGLAVILVGDDRASHLYVEKKEHACQQVGIDFHKYVLEEDDGQGKLLEVIDFLNQDDTINAILIQLPLPEGYDEDEAIQRIDPAKDVDGFHPENIKLLLAGTPRLIPGLPLGVQKLIEKTQVDIRGKQALIIANSPVFIKPMEHLLQQAGATTVSTQPSDPEVREKTKTADIVITAVGACDFLRGDDLKRDAIGIDIGINRDEDNNLCGDIEPESADKVLAFRSPVPGGVGPVTVALLLYNTLELSK